MINKQNNCNDCCSKSERKCLNITGYCPEKNKIYFDDICKKECSDRSDAE